MTKHYIVLSQTLANIVDKKSSGSISKNVGQVGLLTKKII